MAKKLKASCCEKFRTKDKNACKRCPALALLRRLEANRRSASGTRGRLSEKKRRKRLKKAARSLREAA